MKYTLKKKFHPNQVEEIGHVFETNTLGDLGIVLDKFHELIKDDLNENMSHYVKEFETWKECHDWIASKLHTIPEFMLWNERNMITEYATKAYLKGREDERKAFIRALKKDDKNH